ncbi:MAG: hypothetical protein U1E35_06980 [Rhodospirillales bacterium]
MKHRAGAGRFDIAGIGAISAGSPVGRLQHRQRISFDKIGDLLVRPANSSSFCVSSSFMPLIARNMFAASRSASPRSAYVVIKRALPFLDLQPNGLVLLDWYTARDSDASTPIEPQWGRPSGDAHPSPRRSCKTASVTGRGGKQRRLPAALGDEDHQRAAQRKARSRPPASSISRWICSEIRAGVPRQRRDFLQRQVGGAAG